MPLAFESMSHGTIAFGFDNGACRLYELHGIEFSAV